MLPHPRVPAGAKSAADTGGAGVGQSGAAESLAGRQQQPAGAGEPDHQPGARPGGPGEDGEGDAGGAGEAQQQREHCGHPALLREYR